MWRSSLLCGGVPAFPLPIARVRPGIGPIGAANGCRQDCYFLYIQISPFQNDWAMWFWLRLTTLIVIFCFCVFSTSAPTPGSLFGQGDVSFSLFAVAFIYLVTSAFPLLFFLVFSASKFRGVLFQAPSLSARPFLKENPLQIFYSVGMLFAVSSLGSALNESLRFGKFEAILGFFMGLGFLTGCRLCRLIYPKEFVRKGGSFVSEEERMLSVDGRQQ